MLGIRPASRTGTVSSCNYSIHTEALPEEPPTHWRNEYHRIWPWTRPAAKATFAILCSVSIGQLSLDETWRSIRGSDDAFQAYADRMASRLSNITIVAGLILSSVTTLMTATPSRPDIVDFTIRASHLLLWISFAILLGGILLGFVVIFIISSCSRHWVVECLASTRFRVWSMLVVIAYPYLSIGVGTVVCVAGLLIAQLSSKDWIIQTTGILAIAVPALMLFLMGIMARQPKHEDRKRYRIGNHHHRQEDGEK